MEEIYCFAGNPLDRVSQRHSVHGGRQNVRMIPPSAY